MQKAVILDKKDVKKILAKHFHVDEKKVICSQYSFTVTLEGEEQSSKDEGEE